MESLKTILYFSIFRYPLTLDEIHSYTNNREVSDTENELQLLMAQKILTQVDDFYVYGSDLDSVIKRLRGNMNAKKIMAKAQERALFISKFPFVESVGVSGSLSKGYYDNDSDIDFFVITKHNKLWVCRTLLMLYKKIFLLNSRKYFCVNYFISDQQLEIEEKNRFTATELKTLIPMQGKNAFEQFYNRNTWIKDYFSKFEINLESIPEIKKNGLTKTLEFFFDNGFGNAIDYLFKSITLRKWRAKFNFLSEDDFKIALKSTKNISKHHPSNFQKKVILSLNDKLEEVQRNYNIVVPKEYV
ncbi:nucleotidyltransferase domain-containing protein [Flavobacterium sp.]|uniref:nucleotidyltransferase domain-containing protein n=1 Tax=Flavobacterium sp. TaxID=239 RepID=UPI002B4B11B3|nr:nucleotidyltransferase domain-containing protein [Flavobacterium sp.]HLP62921.1 nucleotidyltransferase domain-containing protein [Flavobacterium sp.]